MDDFKLTAEEVEAVAADDDDDDDDVDPVVPVTVLNCSWINIMWSPKRILKFNGVFPLRKSFTCESFSDSSACITVFSGRWACNQERMESISDIFDLRKQNENAKKKHFKMFQISRRRKIVNKKMTL